MSSDGAQVISDGCCCAQTITDGGCYDSRSRQGCDDEGRGEVCAEVAVGRPAGFSSPRLFAAAAKFNVAGALPARFDVHGSHHKKHYR